MQTPGWQNELVNRYNKLRQHTLRQAQRQGWPIRKNYSSQRIIQLQELDSSGQPVYYTLHNVEAARGTRTLALQGGGSLPIALSGSSAIMAGRLGLWDGGRVLESHQEFGITGKATAKIIQKDNVTLVSDHTTHLAGTLVGQGINPEAKGMAYGAQLSVWDYTNDITELVTAAPNLLVSNHAYGPVVGWVYNASRPGTSSDLKWEWWGNTTLSATEDYLFGFYTTKTQDIDRLAYNNPYFLMVRSADNKRSETGPPAGTAYFLKNTNNQSTALRSRNDAYDVIPADATAKNILTIGAADVHYSTANLPTLTGSASYSGWGPTDDGRIKPDLLGVGSMVLSSIATNKTEYGTFSGTSMASANVSGSLFLLQELYARQRGAGLPTSGQFMRAATLKGLVLHTADRPNPETGPDYRQGWGLLNAEAAARVLLNEELAHLVLEQSLTPGKTFSQTITAQGNEPLVVTLCWTDPEGTATSLVPNLVNSRTPKLINDLDLRLSNGQTTDLPFVLDPNHPDQAATRGNNSRDNIEQIYIAKPTPGKSYTLTISIKGNMTYSSQPYSVVVSGLHRVHCALTASILPDKDTTICAGTNLPLQARNFSASLSYRWLRDGTALANGAMYEAIQAGSYVLRVTDANGCSATSKPIQIQTRAATASLTPNSNQWLCNPGSSVHLEAVSANRSTTATVSYEWLRNNTLIADAYQNSLQAFQPGNYQVRVTQEGCQALSSPVTIQTTSVNNLSLVPEETELKLPKGATVTLKAPVDSSFRYQWYRNDSILTNARQYQLSVAKAGTYKVQVTQHTCVGWSATRLVQTTLVTATMPDPIQPFIFFPNPAEHTLSIRYANPASKRIQISVLDSKGVIRQTSLIEVDNGQIESSISIQQLPPGIYIIQLTDGLINQNAKFVKK